VLLRRDDDLADPLLAEARATTNRVARTFSLACRMLPRDVRDDVYRLYLVFRTLDDLVDDGDPRAAARIEDVEAWCSTGAVRSREARLLAELAERHAIPVAALLDFCAGMRADLERCSFATEDDVDRYCYRVAGTVGIVMSEVLGHGGDGVEVRRTASALGMAMQRTNILRDIDEDRAAGRVYVSDAAIARFGVPEPGDREDLLRDQIARADALYDEGLAGVRRLRRGRWAVRTAATMYREILRQIERDGYGARAGRAVVPARRKLTAAARGTL
jgi:15-cis-phytoene synthase